MDLNLRIDPVALRGSLGDEIARKAHDRLNVDLAKLADDLASVLDELDFCGPDDGLAYSKLSALRDGAVEAAAGR